MPTAEEDEASRTQRGLIDLAKTTPDDLYTLLSLPSPSLTPDAPALTPAILKKAWRTTALLHHPDKNRGKEAEAADKLDTARKAFDVLSDEKAREAFDARQRGVREKREREEKLEGRRRVMKEELERAERGGGQAGNGLKRKAETPEEVKEREVQRLAAEGARRRNEKVAEMRREEEDRTLAMAAVKRRKEMKRAGYTDVGDDEGKTASTARNGNGTSNSFRFNTTTNGSNAPPTFSATIPTSTSTTGNKLQATLERLKEAQRKKLSEKIRQDDAAAEIPGT